MAQTTRDGTDSGLQVLVRPAVFAPLLVAASLLISGLLVDRGLPTNDEGGILTLAARILRGAVFYRDLDSYHFPGAPYLLAGWLAIFGESVNAARWLSAFLFSGLVLAVYLTAVQLLDRGRAALVGLGLFSFKVFAAPAFNAYMYSDAALCFTAFAIAAIVGHSFGSPSKRLVAAGFLVAVASAFKQNFGIYFSIVLFVLLLTAPLLLGTPASAFRDRCREIGAYLLGFSLAAVPMAGYFVAKGLLPQLIASGLIRPLLQYLPTSGISFAEPLKWWQLGQLRGGSAFPFFVAPYWSMLMNEQLPGEGLYSAYWLVGELFSRLVYSSIPILVAVVVFRWLRALRSGSFSDGARRCFVYSALAGAVVFTAFPRADLYHILSVYPIAFPMLFMLGPRNGAAVLGSGPAAPRPRVAIAAVAVLLIAAATLSFYHQSLKTHRMQLARADLHIEPARAWVESVVRFVDAKLAPDAPLFVYGNEALFYFLTDRYFEWPFPWLYPGQAGGNDGKPLAQALRRSPPPVIIRGLMSWPGAPSIPDYTSSVNNFILFGYRAYGDFFVAHPPPAGPPPDAWAVDILVRRRTR